MALEFFCWNLLKYVFSNFVAYLLKVIMRKHSVTVVSENVHLSPYFSPSELETMITNE